ncbi:MAG: LPS export ABC transporter periplasmic protein LptC [bacterium]
MESKYTRKNQFIIGFRNFTILAGAILLLVYLIVVSGQAAKDEFKTRFEGSKKQITHIDEAVAFGYEKGAKIGEVRSEVAEEDKKSDSSRLTRIYELILYKGGEENVRINGDSGIWDKTKEELTLIGNVRVESADGTTHLKTEKLIWVERTKTLSCPTYVDFTVEENHFTSNSLYSADDLATIDFIGNVHMFVVGLKGANFITREGDFPVEDIEDEPKGDGMNVISKYVHYDKGEKKADCYPFIPKHVSNRYNIDSDGNLAVREYQPFFNDLTFLTDPNYVEALNQSIAQTDLTSQEQAFLRGEISFDELTKDEEGNSDASQSPDNAGNGVAPPPGFGTAPGPDRTPPTGGQALPMMGIPPRPGVAEGESGQNPGETAGESGQSPGVAAGEAGQSPGVTASESGQSPGVTAGETGHSPGVAEGEAGQTPTIPTGPTLPGGAIPLLRTGIPKSDPEKILSSPDYSRITEWEIAKDLNGELYEDNPTFVPDNELRTGTVFCYRKNKKFWCEQLKINLGDHKMNATGHVDARFSNLKEASKEPPKSKAGKAVQESPTQIIGNYLVHNWETNVSEGYGRILAMQPEKDIEADNVIYYEDSDVIHAWGDVIVHQFGGEWLVKSGAIEDIKDKRAKEDARKPSVITSDAMLSYNKRVSWAVGDVVFRQEKQTIKSDRAQYEDGTEILVMAGKVKYDSKDGEHISSALLTMDLYVEEYIAEGNVIARNKTPEEYRKNISEQREKEPKPEDMARARLLENRTAAGLGDWTEEAFNPPLPPPIEVLPDENGNVEPLPPLNMGPEVPSSDETAPPAPPVPPVPPEIEAGEISAGNGANEINAGDNGSDSNSG